MTPSVAPGTLYADWLARRERLREYHGEHGPIVAIQLRVLDYLVERYRDDAEALRPAPPPLDAVYLNQRAIVVDHHRSFGVVAGVKSNEEATNRVAAIVARMYDPARGEATGIDLEQAAFTDDPWFGWSEPDPRTIKEYWSTRAIGKEAMKSMPYLPTRIINKLYQSVARLDQTKGLAAGLLARCRNRLAVGLIAHAWRTRVAAQRHDCVTLKLRDALVQWDRRAADIVRCMLSDEVGEVRMTAALLLADIGELRDIGILADLLAMPQLPDEEPSERTVLAGAMTKLARRLQEPASALDFKAG